MASGCAEPAAFESEAPTPVESPQPDGDGGPDAEPDHDPNHDPNPARDGYGPPLVVDDHYVVGAGESLELEASLGVLANDAMVEAVVEDAVESEHGVAVSLGFDGALRYDAPSDFGGCDAFSYSVKGRDGTQASGRVAVRIEHPWRQPSPRAMVEPDAMLDLAATPGDRAGTAVAVLSDFDGDGAPDYAMGAPQPAMGDGAPGLVHLHLSGEATMTTLVGMSTRSDTGSVLADAGDVNGDGIPDLLVGAPKTNLGNGPMGDVVGRAFVVFGGPDPVLDLEDVHAGEGGFSVTGSMMADFAGSAVAGVGDWSGDGRGEVAIGVPRLDTAGEDAGAVAIVWGKSDGDPVPLHPLGAGGRWIFGEDALDHAGETLAMPGDLDGDGVMDLVVGAPRLSRDHFEQGRVYVVYGPILEHVGLHEMLAGAGGWAMSGMSDVQRLGTVLAAIGDVDGDGRADFAIGEPAYDEGRGRVLVVTDPASAISDVVDGASGFAVEGDGGNMGMSIAAAGDVNDDGLADLVIGAPTQDAGRVYVVFGRSGEPSVSLADVAAGIGGFALDGTAPGDATGRAVAGGADLDGDGALDLLVGAPHAGGPGAYTGAVHRIRAAFEACP